MYTYEIQLAYDEYCQDCYWEGITPKPIWEWWGVRNNPHPFNFERGADEPSAPFFHYITSSAICQAFFIRRFAQRVFPKGKRLISQPQL
jgi:hypothetical protein